MQLKILHIAVHKGWQGQQEGGSGINAGDTALNPLIQRFFCSIIPSVEFTCRQVWEQVKLKDVEQWNKIYDYILIGGGGLFLNDQPGLDATLSGWTWQCSIENLRFIDVPFIVFSVGFNQFYGGQNFSNLFWESVSIIYEKSVFFSLRNTASIQRVSEGISSHSGLDRCIDIALQPCLTTLYSDLQELSPQHTSNWNPHGTRVALNLAFDRIKFRVPLELDLFYKFIYDSISMMLNGPSDLVSRVALVKHKEVDSLPEHLLSILTERFPETFTITDVIDADTDQIFCDYSVYDYAIGMRGHGIMIPLGSHVYPFSLVTHPKLFYLLDDLNISRASAAYFVDRTFTSTALVNSFYKFQNLCRQNPSLFQNGIDRVKSQTTMNAYKLKQILFRSFS